MNVLRERGWFLTEQGYDLVSDFGNITDVQQLIKRASDFDLKEIGSGEAIESEGNVVLQIQKIRNTAAPKNNEESKSAPRLLKLSLTDGKNNYQAIEYERIPCLSLNTPPGSKILIEKSKIPVSHGIFLLRPNHVKKFLGGHVVSLVEKWELNKKLALHSRVRSVEEGGPPPWIPFGQKIINIIDKSKNLKPLNDKAIPVKENSEFEAQRNDAIAEAAKKANKKVFGGGNKQLLDHSVQKIIEQGFTMEQAESALKWNRNNIGRALRSLQKTDPKHAKEPKEPKFRRFEKRGEETGKPSSGKVSLFDFLEDKLPAQLESLTVNDTSATNNYDFDSDRTQSQVPDYQSRGRPQKGAGWSQNSKREDQTKWSNFPSTDAPYFTNPQQKQRPPRFQNHDVFQPADGAAPRNFKAPPMNDYKSQNSYQNSSQNSRGAGRQNSGDPRGRNRNQEEFQRRGNAPPEGYQKGAPGAARGPRGQHKFGGGLGEEGYGRGAAVYNSQQQKESQFSSRQESAIATGSWSWRKGDKCLAKYWEDNKYYNAEVFAVSDRTCVVQFKDFNNYEEVLQVDCIPITEDNHQYNSMSSHNMKMQDYRVSNRNSRYNHNHPTNVESREGNKNYKKRNQQRSAQPIYQPPAQRNVFSVEQPSAN